MGKRGLKNFLLKTTLLALVPSLLALVVNAARPGSLEWIASEPFEIYADCKDVQEQADAIALDRLQADLPRFLIVDSRPLANFRYKRLPGSISLPYDSLFPVETEKVRQLRGRAGGRKLLVIGEGVSARELANELLAAGLRNIYYLEPADDWRKLMTARVKP